MPTQNQVGPNPRPPRQPRLTSLDVVSPTQSRPLTPGSATLTDLLAAIAEGARQREQERTLPHDQIRRLREAGLGRLRLPAEDGGAGATLPDLFGFVIDLAAADSNVAHALRAHFGFVEEQLHNLDRDAGRRWLDLVAQRRRDSADHHRRPQRRPYLLRRRIFGAISDDAVALTRRRERNFSHASQAVPADDPQVLQVVGEIASDAGPPARRRRRLGHQVRYGRDRHWLDIRTISTHNPTFFKAAAIGDHLVNGTPPPQNGFF